MVSAESNTEAVEGSYLYWAQYAYAIGTIGRIVLILVSYKKPTICKLYLQYSLLLSLLDFFIM